MSIPSPASLLKKTLGQAGETLASVYLEAKDYQILARNVRCGQYELDLVAFDPRYQETVFVEVKTRRNDDGGNPADAVDKRKLKAFITAGKRYAKQHHLQTDWRFDIVAITPANIDHYENITFP
ncbi:YraN family protein [bacterium]|nr:YraN family protein [bacterium]